MEIDTLKKENLKNPEKVKEESAFLIEKLERAQLSEEKAEGWLERAQSEVKEAKRKIEQGKGNYVRINLIKEDASLLDQDKALLEQDKAHAIGNFLARDKELQKQLPSISYINNIPYCDKAPHTKVGFFFNQSDEQESVEYDYGNLGVSKLWQKKSSSSQ